MSKKKGQLSVPFQEIKERKESKSIRRAWWLNILQSLKTEERGERKIA